MASAQYRNPPHSHPRRIEADYATRERLESIIAQCNSAFMTDFDRFIGSYRLPRALAYANRRLNDNINTLLHLANSNTYGRQSRTAGEGHHCRAQAVLRQRPVER